MDLNKLEGGLRMNAVHQKNPLVTVITVVFNGEASIERTIKSVAEQKTPEIEYIIVDGASRDNTVKIIRQYEQVVDYWISEKDKGIYNAMNKGATYASGKYITFLNADDTMKMNYLQTFTSLIQDKDYFSCGVKMIYNNKTINWVPFNIIPAHNTFFWRMPLPHPGLMVKKTVFDELGGFNEKYRYAADYDFILRLVKKYNGIFSDKVMIDFYMGGASSNKAILLENNSIRKNNHSNKLLVSLAHQIELFKWKIAKIRYR
ncbi:glycosyltransferase family 2 protein [Chitinophaga niabensis]|uniref:glycosyltransferase family 2 protein n=1 Tax=Chitinophaga niabensis TaxID=536979 RepID=UPI0031B9F047